jgi:hypothetical protein
MGHRRLLSRAEEILRVRPAHFPAATGFASVRQAPVESRRDFPGRNLGSQRSIQGLSQLHRDNSPAETQQPQYHGHGGRHHNLARPRRHNQPRRNHHRHRNRLPHRIRSRLGPLLLHPHQPSISKSLAWPALDGGGDGHHTVASAWGRSLVRNGLAAVTDETMDDASHKTRNTLVYK